MRAAASTLRAELIGLGGVVERNVYLTRRYIWWDVAFMVWTIANTLTIVFIAKGIEATGGQIDVNRTTTTLLIGAVVWAYLGIIFEMPVLIYALIRVGAVQRSWLAKQRRYFFLLSFVVAAIATPTPDPFTPAIVAIPIYLLFELGLFLGRFGGGRRAAA